MNVLGLPSEKEYWCDCLSEEVKEQFRAKVRFWNAGKSEEEIEDMAKHIAYERKRQDNSQEHLCRRTPVMGPRS